MLTSMFRRFSILFTTVFLSYASPAHSQTESPVIRVKVDLASVAVRVTDRQGHDVPGLSPEDFTLTEDGQKQKIAFFDTEKEPIALSILVDSSSSMNLSGKTEAAQDMLDQVIGASRPQDEVFLLRFTDHVVSFRQVTREQPTVSTTTGTASSRGGGTALYDAIASALCHFRASKSIRQAVVVITDGADQHSRLRLEELIQLVHSSNAQLFMVGFYSQPEYEVFKKGEDRVALVTRRKIDNPIVVFKRLARESGAESFFPTSKKGLHQVLEEISSILRAQYTLAYYPAVSDKKSRRIQVKLQRGGLTIRARERVSSQTSTIAGVQFEGSTCEVSAQQHPYPYESRLRREGDKFLYREDFSSADSGWPNREGSRYTAKGYELVFKYPKHKDNEIIVNPGPLGTGVLAAYGPWWNEYHASVEVDAGWIKMHRPNHRLEPKREELYASSAGLAFRVDDFGYYAFLLSTSSQAYEAEALSFRLVKRSHGSFSDVQIVPWTRLSDKQVQQKSIAEIKLSLECVREQLTLFVEEQQVARVQDTGCSGGYVGTVLFGEGRVVFRNLLVEGTR
jgi:Ca-activated chloride channel homolog